MAGGSLLHRARVLPAHADIHLNLALVYEKRGKQESAREHRVLYLRYAPIGRWADQARADVNESFELRKAQRSIDVATASDVPLRSSIESADISVGEIRRFLDPQTLRR